MELIHYIADFTKIAFQIYFWIHIIAIFFTWVQADPNNAFVFYINKITKPVWFFFEQHAPHILRNFSAYLALLSIVFLEEVIPRWITTFGEFFIFQMDVILTLIKLIIAVGIGFTTVTIHLLGFIVLLSIIWTIITLTNPPLNNPLVRMIMVLIDPLITPLQKRLPHTNIDLSPIVLGIGAFICLYYIGKFSFYLKSLFLVSFTSSL